MGWVGLQLGLVFGVGVGIGVEVGVMVGIRIFHHCCVLNLNNFEKKEGGLAGTSSTYQFAADPAAPS